MDTTTKRFVVKTNLRPRKNGANFAVYDRKLRQFHGTHVTFEDAQREAITRENRATP